MSQISRAIEEIIKADEEAEKKLEQAKLEAKKIVESARVYVDEYRKQKEDELLQLRKSLEEKNKRELEVFKEIEQRRVGEIISSYDEVLRSKREEIVSEVAKKVIEEIIGKVLAK